MQTAAREIAAQGKTIGLVPTMGFLHEGHLSLIRRAKKETDVVIVSVFVNPTQFAPNEDLDKYPRDEKGDVRKITEAGGDIVFTPKTREVYPDNFQTCVEVEKLTGTLEGVQRPTHFRGVTTIVSKLFNICRPDLVVFGQKDYQQAQVLRQMTHDLGYPMKFVIAPTVREASGLALSSRNKYFTPEQKLEALGLYRALGSAKAMVRSGEKSVKKIEREMRAVILSHCPTAEIDYIAFTDLTSLVPVRSVVRNTVCSLAVRLHGVRLIDNMKLA